MSARVPFRIYRPIYRKCAFPKYDTRSFSTTLQVAAAQKVPDPLRSLVISQQLKGKPREAFLESVMQDDQAFKKRDFGLMHGAFVRAPIRTLLSSYPLTKVTSWRTLAWYYWKFLAAKANETGMAASYWFSNRKNRNLPEIYIFPWGRKDLHNQAWEKYKLLYQSFARGDTKAIDDLCLDEFARRLRTRIATRRPGRVMQWRATNSSVRVISNKVRAVGDREVFEEGEAMQQLVFRIKSAQALNGSEQRNLVQSKEVVEYMVMRRLVMAADANDWHIWGFVDEWMPEKIAEDAELQRQERAYQAASI